MKPNTLYAIGSVFIGIGVLFAYHAGRQEMREEIKEAENKKWKEAHIDLTETDPERVNGK